MKNTFVKIINKCYNLTGKSHEVTYSLFNKEAFRFLLIYVDKKIQVDHRHAVRGCRVESIPTGHFS